jgi:hypothetical protein
MFSKQKQLTLSQVSTVAGIEFRVKERTLFMIYGVSFIAFEQEILFAAGLYKIVDLHIGIEYRFNSCVSR